MTWSGLSLFFRTNFVLNSFKTEEKLKGGGGGGGGGGGVGGGGITS